MKIKKGASLIGLNIKMRPVLIAADRIWREHGQELVVTAGTDGEHSAGSLHPYGFALDFRTRYFSKSEVLQVAEELKEALPAEYDVVVHDSHIHAEYDEILNLQ